MNPTETIILDYVVLCGIAAVAYGWITSQQILNASAGNNTMQEIAGAIQEGAQAYLNRQYKTIAIVGAAVLVLVAILFSPLVALGYLIGAALSGVAGYVGMIISVRANVRTAEASRKGLAKV